MLMLCSCQNIKIRNNNSLTAPAVTGEFKFTVLKVGQADAIILQTENHNIIIDCGEKDDGDKILDYLNDHNITGIDCLFITHFDKDHVGGAAEVINNVDIKQIITPNYQETSDEYKNYLDAASNKGITPIKPGKNMEFILDDVLFNVYPPLKKSYDSDNDYSLVISVTHGENNFLFTGDGEAERITEILKVIGGDYDFLKVPHHGRYNKKTESLIKSITPKYSVITDSDKNPAQQKTVDILEKYGSDIYYSRDGDISVLSNGTEIKITQ